MPIQKIT